ncbi:MAG: ATP synthase subunit I [bacterium]|nr:ATP synthase subunit I [bacterium]
MRADVKRLVLEVCTGIVCYNGVLLLAAVCLRLSSDILLGLILGGILAILAFVHMAAVSDQTLDLKAEEPARKKATIHAMLRMVVLIAVLIVTMRVPYFNTVAVVVGILGLKAGAYLQPMIHKLRNRHE